MGIAFVILVESVVLVSVVLVVECIDNFDRAWLFKNAIRIDETFVCKDCKSDIPKRNHAFSLKKSIILLVH